MSEYVFRKDVEDTTGLPILYLAGVGGKETKGEIGIEIEVEGNFFEKIHVPSPWKYDKDGSLRGKDNAEYILRQPILFKDVPKAVDILWDHFKKYGSILDESNRTSVHVHLNAQGFYLNRLCSFFALYFLVEDLLTNWCGDHRVGNLFCLRAKDAPAIISDLKVMLRSESIHLDDGHHYAGLNASALKKFGSIEIRSLRGVTDKQTIIDWVSVLQRLYELSAKFPDPREIPEGFSGNGPLAYLQNLLGAAYSTIMDNVEYSPQEVAASLYEGIRLAQDLCYCRDWSEYQALEVRPDPFGRTTKVVSSHLSEIIKYKNIKQKPAMSHNPFQAYQESLDELDEEEIYEEEEEEIDLDF